MGYKDVAVLFYSCFIPFYRSACFFLLNLDHIMGFMNIFSDSSEQGSLGDRLRNKRFAYFNQRIAKFPKPMRILDVGGRESWWVNRGYQNKADVDIVLLNLAQEKTSTSNISAVVGDATDLKQYASNSFDIVFSNSVIEHLHNYENQKKMASEVMRVGKYYIVQTPNRYFPIEPHYVLPFFQFMPKSFRYFILTKTKLSRLKKWDSEFAKSYIEEIALLSRTQMQDLFPNGKLYKEWFAGMVKSFTAHNLPD